VTYNNKQVSKALRQNILKWFILGVNSQNRQELGFLAPDPHLDAMTRECARP